ncbi:MAG TPA: hypothetical protein HA303_05440 [Candidatus Thalassarchaeaceae archaeon]|nr:MAG TPA: hypothetical protein D7H79_05410 [Candidatus Poseidoniales archaeon]HIH80644.1 hypothetical protein [Candidatus Thalassarchaeaceae archaeon]
MSSEHKLRSLRELARRLLRSRGVEVYHPSDWKLSVSDLSLRLSDIAPNLYIGIEFRNNTSDEIRLELSGEGGGMFSASPPEEIDYVWIPMDEEREWDMFISELFALASAGYPGCVGCGGPDAELPWDEALSRSALLSDSRA